MILSSSRFQVQVKSARPNLSSDFETDCDDRGTLGFEVGRCNTPAFLGSPLRRWRRSWCKWPGSGSARLAAQPAFFISDAFWSPLRRWRRSWLLSCRRRRPKRCRSLRHTCPQHHDRQLRCLHGRDRQPRHLPGRDRDHDRRARHLRGRDRDRDRRSQRRRSERADKPRQSSKRTEEPRARSLLSPLALQHGCRSPCRLLPR